MLALDRKKKDIDSSLLIRQILDRFEQPWHSGSVETKFRIHISSIVCPRDANNLNGLIDYIQYMRSLSSENGNVVLKTAEMDIDRPKRELRIRKLLNDAVDHKGFEVFYQPIYSVTEKQNRICGSTGPAERSEYGLHFSGRIYSNCRKERNDYADWRICI